MSAFETLQTRHQELLKLEQEKADLLNEVQAYIEEAKNTSDSIGLPQEREQLRANLRYWAGYVYDHTTPNFYPTTDLRPYSGPALSAVNWAPWIIAAGIFLVAFFIVLGAGGLATLQFLNNARPTLVNGGSAFPSQPAVLETPTAFNTPEPLFTPTPVTVELTATPTFEAQPTPLPTQDTAGIVAQLTSPADGQEISPRVKLAGTFSNLQPGWTIHVLLQPLSQAGRYFPLEQFVTVQAGSPSGDWALDAAFGEGAELEKAEQYNISLVVALDDKTRAELVRGARSGLDTLPSGVLPFPQVTTVRRGAYKAINEVRVVYSELFSENNAREIVAALPDGSDPLRITFTASLDELQPDLSTDGRFITFVGRRSDPSSGQTVLSLWTMQSNGQNALMLFEQAGVEYEQPVWSPDGRYIAYDANIPGDSGQVPTNLFIYDTFTGENTRLTKGFPADRYPSWMPDGNSILFSSLSAATNTLGLFSLDVASREFSRLFDSQAEETQPAVSPDGAKAVFVSFPEDSPESNRDIYVLDLETLQSTRITEHAALDWYPRWGPDGKTIYFVSHRVTGNPAILAVNADGTGARKIISSLASLVFDVGLMDAFLPITNP